MRIQHKDNGAGTWRTIDTASTFPKAQEVARKYRKENSGCVRVLDDTDAVVFTANF